MARGASSSSRQLTFSSSTPAAGTATTTVTLNAASPSHRPQIRETLVLKLKPLKKVVSWKEGTVDNEFMNKKRSKKCCIFHKEKPFDEDDSDSDCDHGHDGDPNCSTSH